MLSDKGFTLIEVLVASIILFLSIATVAMAYKEYTSCRLKQVKYERIYMTALSLMSELEDKKPYNIGFESGTINGLKYSISIKKVISKRNFVIGLNKQTTGNFGEFLLTLYKVTLNISGKEFVLYLTNFEKVIKR